MTAETLKGYIKAGSHRAFVEAALTFPLHNASFNEQTNFATFLDKIPLDVWTSFPLLRKKIAILGGYNTTYLKPLLRWQLLRRGIVADVFEGEYGLFEQMIYSQDDNLKSFAPDLVYFCVGSDHLNRSALSAEKDRFIGLWQKAHEWLGCDILQNSFLEPSHRAFGNLEFRQAQSIGNQIRRLNLALFEAAPAFVKFSDVDSLSAQVGRTHWRDEKLYDVSKAPAALPLLPLYAENAAGVISAMFGRSRKCLALDLDNTLWGGVVGDDGWENVKVGPDNPTAESFYRFQQFILELKQRGVILAICSKNEESIAKEAFLKKAGMVLKLEDISCFKANWEPKSENIKAIAKELNIGLDSIVFVDDNPVECEQVKGQLPMVEVVQLPKDSSQYTLTLSSRNFFETVGVTDDDLQKTQQYLANKSRDELVKQMGNYSDFLRELKMTAECGPFDKANLMRITQLINKTNQFNLTTRRYSESQIEEIMGNPAWITRYLKLKDKFGDNGLIANVMAKVDGEKMEIDTWLMSCRVLKRGVENYLMRELIREAVGRKLKKVEALYIPTEKNMMVKDFYPSFGFLSDGQSGPSGSKWVLDLSNVSKVKEILEKEIFIAQENA